MDGLLLKVTSDFLIRLNKEGFYPSNIRFMHKPKGIGTKTFTTELNSESWLSANSTLINSPRLLCSSGSYPLVTALTLTCSYSNHIVQCKWFDIFESRKVISLSSYDDERNDYINTSVEAAKTHQDQIISDYVTNAIQCMEVRSSSYVDPCYVDAGYVTP